MAFFDRIFGKGRQAAAARTAELRGDLARAAELFGEAGQPEEAARVMILRADSNVVLDPAPKESSSSLINGLRLLTGKLLSVYGKGRPVRISTMVATIGIRGTGVYMESDPEQSYICTCYGVTDISAINDAESKETVSATHHDRPLYILGKAPAGASIRNAPFINHTDQELMLIESLVGRTPPFVFPGNQYNAPRRDY